MHRVPMFLRGLFRRALHVGLEEISEGCRVSKMLPRIASLGAGEELSSARQVLEGADLAPGTEETLKALRRRPAMLRDAILPELNRQVPDVLFTLDSTRT